MNTQRHWGRRLLVASAALLSSLFFFKFSRLAETDVPATLFVTAAVYFFVAADHSSKTSHRLLRLHLAGPCVGLTVLAKGMPAAFPLLFLLVWALVERKWRLLLSFAVSGAWLTAASLSTWTLIQLSAGKLPCRTLTLALELPQLSNSVRRCGLSTRPIFAR